MGSHLNLRRPGCQSYRGASRQTPNPEATNQDAGLWAEEYADELAAFGKKRADVLRNCQERGREMGALAGAPMENLLKLSDESAAVQLFAGAAGARPLSLRLRSEHQVSTVQWEQQ